MSFRKEKKYRLSLSDQKILKNKLIKKGMRKLYPKRKISSIYFDTQSLVFYSHSEEGILPRKKIRIRWYDKNLSKLTYETKISSIEGRYKISKPFKMKITKNYSSLKIIDKEFGILKPKILVTYFREYYLLNNLRFTFDTNIKYKKIEFNSQLVNSDKECVMEVKSNFKTEDDFIDQLVGYPTSRFSKYSRGIHFSDKNNYLF